MYNDSDARDNFRLTTIIITIIALVLCLTIQCCGIGSKFKNTEADLEKINTYANQLAERRLKAYDSAGKLDQIRQLFPKEDDRLVISSKIDTIYQTTSNIVTQAEREAVAAFSVKEPFDFQPMIIIACVGAIIFMIPGLVNAYRISREHKIADRNLERKLKAEREAAKIVNEKVLLDPSFDPLKAVKPKR